MLRCFFLCFKQKTTNDMRISDWSSDVCSSDLRKVRARVLTDFDGTRGDGFLQCVQNDQDQWSSELRYAADLSDWLSMTAGVYYFDQSFSFSETRDLNNHAQLLATRSNLDNSSFAAFAEVDIEPVADLTVTLGRSEEHTSELQSLMRNSYAVFCLKKKK